MAAEHILKTRQKLNTILGRKYRTES
ncbi:MAG: hypothetical protein ACLSGB_06575 [Dorea sp.]